MSECADDPAGIASSSSAWSRPPPTTSPGFVPAIAA